MARVIVIGPPNKDSHSHTNCIVKCWSFDYVLPRIDYGFLVKVVSVERSAAGGKESPKGRHYPPSILPVSLKSRTWSIDT